MKIGQIVPATLAAKLGVETREIHEILQGDDVADLTGVSNSEKEIAWRLKHLQSKGLFCGNPFATKKIPWGQIVAAQADVAFVHGLIYRKAGTQSHWALAGEHDTPDTLAMRSENHFTQIFNSTDFRRLKRIDLALLAHAHQIPIALIEVPDRGVFEAQVDRICTGYDPFLTGPEILQRVAIESTDLLIAPVPRILEECKVEEGPQRGFVVDEPEQEPATLAVDEPFAVYLRRQESVFDPVNALLFGCDPAGKIELVTRPSDEENELRHNGSIVIPRLDKLSAGNTIPRIDEAGEFGIYLLVGAAPFDQFPAFADMIGRRAATFRKDRAELCDQDFDWLRRAFITSQPEALKLYVGRVLVR